MHDLQEILIKLERIEAQQNRLISDYESEKELRKERTKDIYKRILDLEKWQAKWGGALIALGIVATLCSIGAFIFNVVKH